jgi:hypothetical protein
MAGTLSGASVFSVTVTLPPAWARNVCVVAPLRLIDPENVSVMVGGVGGAGDVGVE